MVHGPGLQVLSSPLLKRFHLNGQTTGFLRETQKLELNHISPKLTLEAEGRFKITNLVILRLATYESVFSTQTA